MVGLWLRRGTRGARRAECGGRGEPRLALGFGKVCQSGWKGLRDRVGQTDPGAAATHSPARCARPSRPGFLSLSLPGAVEAEGAVATLPGADCYCCCDGCCDGRGGGCSLRESLFAPRVRTSQKSWRRPRGEDLPPADICVCVCGGGWGGGGGNPKVQVPFLGGARVTSNPEAKQKVGVKVGASVPGGLAPRRGGRRPGAGGGSR